jgi:hypothetical protein
MEKSGLRRGVAYLEGVDFLAFYCLSASEIWPDKEEWSLGKGALSEGEYCI